MASTVAPGREGQCHHEGERRGDAALRAATCSVPTLRRLAAIYMLAHAADYDDASQAALTEVLVMIAPVMCGALRDPFAFFGASALPTLVDAMRTTLADRPQVAQKILDDLLSALPQWRQPVGSEYWRGVELTCDRLLSTGQLKREVQGQQLPKRLADSVRRVRKLAQANVGGADSSRRLARAFGSTVERSSSRRMAIDMEALRREYEHRRLDSYTG